MAAQHLIGFGMLAVAGFFALQLTRRQGAGPSADFFGGPGALDTFRALDAAGLNQKPFFASQPVQGSPDQPQSSDPVRADLPPSQFFDNLFGFDLFNRKAATSVPVFETTATPGVSRDVDTVARTIWGEARGEGRVGMRAVAAVIMNRVRSPRWADSPAKVATQAYQFSVWNEGDPNREKALAVTTSDRRFREALEIAEDAISGQLSDPTGGADHYYADSIQAPDWAQGARVVSRIGRHIFLNGVA